ncbi:MAG TPA: hypothetical protein VNW24_10095 [Stellaceae bacterium]|jgi:hypothetical protein|nr:hypothetical protein [Stellaceae bacterium]
MIRRIWAVLLAAVGFVILFQLSDVVARGLLWVHEQLGLQGQGAAPRVDQFVAQQPMVGAILFVGGLVLWFMPREA